MKPAGSPVELMYPWMESLPRSWDVVQARRLFRERKITGFPEEPLLSVTQDVGVVTREESEIRVWNPGSDVSGYKLVRRGDFIISLRSFQGGFEHSEIRGLVSPAYTPFFSTRLQAGQLKFLAHYFKSLPFISALQPLTSGIRQGKNISFSDFGELPLPLPAGADAALIASFLDRETEEIDTLIEKKRRLLDLLEEKRTALITRAVIKGLNPGVPMKESGVEWLGEIPAHWEVLPLKFLMARIVDCLHSTPRYDDRGEYPAIRTSDIDGGVLRLEQAKRVNREEYRNRVARMVPHHGDILYSREGERYGHAAMVPSDVQVCLAQRLMHFRTAPNHSAAFMMWALNSQSTYAQASLDTAGATSPHVNVETIRNIQIPVPPLKEQKEVARCIGSAMNHLDAVRNRITKAISLLKEYRTALISAAVTGQIDVRDRVPA